MRRIGGPRAGCGIRMCGCVAVWRIFYRLPPGGCHTSRRRREKKLYLFFAKGEKKMVYFPKEFREVVVEKIDFLYNFCHFFGHFCRFLVIFSYFYSFWCIFTLHCGGHFPNIFRICWNFLGDPRELFRRFWAFWTIFGPNIFCLFCRKSRKPQKNKIYGCVAAWGNFYIDPAPRGGGCHTSPKILIPQPVM